MANKLFLLTIIILLWFVVDRVWAHEAPTGWKYPLVCCSNQDCKQISDKYIKELPTGYELTITGEVVGFTDRRVKHSPDGFFHICQQSGDFDKGRILCIFVPPRSF